MKKNWLYFFTIHQKIGFRQVHGRTPFFFACRQCPLMSPKFASISSPKSGFPNTARWNPCSQWSIFYSLRLDMNSCSVSLDRMRSAMCSAVCMGVSPLNGSQYTISRGFPEIFANLPGFSRAEPVAFRPTAPHFDGNGVLRPFFRSGMETLARNGKRLGTARERSNRRSAYLAASARMLFT